MALVGARAARPTPPMTSTRYEDNADVLTEKVPYLLRAMGDRAFPLTGASYELLEIACRHRTPPPPSPPPSPPPPSPPPPSPPPSPPPPCRQDTHVDWWGGDDNVNWKSMSTCLEGVLPAEWDACAPPRRCSQPLDRQSRLISSSAAHAFMMRSRPLVARSRPRQHRAAGAFGAAEPTEPQPEPWQPQLNLT